MHNEERLYIVNNEELPNSVKFGDIYLSDELAFPLELLPGLSSSDAAVELSKQNENKKVAVCTVTFDENYIISNVTVNGFYQYTP
jgi:hypothetical protein